MKLIWGGAEQQSGRWRLGLWGTYERTAGSRATYVAISVRGLLRWLAVLAVAGYLAATSALYVWLERNPGNLVTYTDTLLLPLRWTEIRQKQGEALIAEGLVALEARRWGEAHSNLRAGLARAPHHRAGRLALARYYTLANRRPLALRVLTEDLAHGYPGRQYLEELFKLALGGEDFDVVIETAGRFETVPEVDRRWLAQQRLQALLAAGRPEDVLSALAAAKDAAGATERELRVIALLELGRPAEAVLVLSEWPQATGRAEPQVLRLRVRALRESEQFAEMEAAIEALRALAPAEPRTHVYAIVQNALAGRADEAARRCEDYLFRFGGSAQNLTLLATGLAESRQATLLGRCVSAAEERGYPLAALLTLQAEVLLRTNDWSGAALAVQRLKPLVKRTDLGAAFVVTWLDLLTTSAASADDGAQATLIGLVQGRPLSMRFYRTSCEVLLAAGRGETAQRVLRAAEANYGASRTLADLSRRIDGALAAQRVSTVAAKAAPDTGPVTAEAFFAELDGLAARREWAVASQRIQAIRVAKPSWLAQREADLLYAQMDYSARRGDSEELLASAARFLDGSRERAERVLALARVLQERAESTEANRLVQAVLRRMPDYPPALRLRKEWTPQPAAGGS